MPMIPVISTLLKFVRVVKLRADAILLSPERNFLHILTSVGFFARTADGKVAPLSISTHNLRREFLYFADKGSGPSGSVGIHDTSREVTNCKQENRRINNRIKNRISTEANGIFAGLR